MDTNRMEQRPRYANWVSSKIVIAGSVATLALLFGARFVLPHSRAAGILLLVLTALCLAFTFYMLRARRALSYEGGGVQGKVLDGVLDQLDRAGWNGRGRLLDVGCGSGALCVKAAKRHPKALITGLDFWGSNWDYSQALCEENARLEGVAARITFRQGSAAQLPFLDDAFDALVSNFVFHEVRSQPDKGALVREALRVLKPGGTFVLQDVFFSKHNYGDIQQFVDALRPYASEIHFVDTRKPDYAPSFLNTPLILGRMGMIWGRK